jgi:hypothetical protein
LAHIKKGNAMKNYRRFTVLLLIAILVPTMVTAVVAIQRQNGQGPKKAKVLKRGDKVAEPFSKRELDEIQTPTVDAAAPEPTDPAARARHRAKGKRYDNGRPQRVEELPGQEVPLPLVAHWWMGLPALPLAQSDAVVLGEVTDAQAHLSGDKSGVYSEFTIRVDELLKGDGGALRAAGGTAVAERPGGKVKFPSGKVQRYGVDKQGMPRVGARYVLFLKSNGDGEDYTIVTGYELREGSVLPLDGAGHGSTALPFDVYNGVSEVDFLASLRDAIAAQGGKSR